MTIPLVYYVGEYIFRIIGTNHYDTTYRPDSGLPICDVKLLIISLLVERKKFPANTPKYPSSPE